MNTGSKAPAPKSKAARAKGVTAAKAAKSKAAKADATPAPGGTDVNPDEARGRSQALGVHYQSLDGIRAVGMMAIFFAHSEFRVLEGAYMALSLFFTLSGFLIVSILLRRRDHVGPLSLRSFWSQRYRRLMPASLLCLFGVVIFGATVADPGQAAEIPGQVAAAAGQVVNWFFIYTEKSYIQLFAAPSPVQHFWSLAVEEQFYIVMPIVFWLIVRYMKTLKPIALFFGVGAIASTLWMAWLYNNGASLDRLYYGTDTRAAEILLGGLLAVVLYRYPLRLDETGRRILAAVGVAAAAITLWAWVTMELADGWVYRGGFLFIALVSCALITSLTSGGPVTWLLSWGFLPAMGRITYGLYLFHWPIMLWLNSSRTGLEGWPLFILQVAVTVAAAIASYHLLEMPIRRGIPDWPKGAMRWAVAPTVAVSIVALAFVAGSREATVGVDGVVAGGNNELPEATVSALSAPVSDVAPAAQPGVPKVLVVGDSMSRSLGVGLEQWAAETNSAVVWNTARLGCGVLDEGLVGEEIGEPNTTLGTGVCDEVRERWVRQVAEFDPDLVIMLSTAWDLQNRQLPDWPEVAGPGDEVFDEYQMREYREAVDVLSAGGAKVLWIQGPCSQLISDAGIDAKKTSLFEVERVRSLNDQVIPQLMEDRSQVRTFDMFTILCPEGDFTEDVPGFDDPRPDGVHFSIEGSSWFAQNYGAAMIAAGMS